MSRYLSAIFAAVVLMAASGLARATPITYAGTFSIKDVSSPEALRVTSESSGFSVPLSLNQEVRNVALANYFVNPKQSLAGLTTDRIEGTFKFTAPVNNLYSVNGDMTEGVVDLFGYFSSAGVLTWDTNDLSISFSDGSALDVGMGPSSFSNLNGTSNAETVFASFTLVKVPEPASLTLLGVGLLGLGTLATRRRNRLGD